MPILKSEAAWTLTKLVKKEMLFAILLIPACSLWLLELLNAQLILTKSTLESLHTAWTPGSSSLYSTHKKNLLGTIKLFFGMCLPSSAPACFPNYENASAGRVSVAYLMCVLSTKSVVCPGTLNNREIPSRHRVGYCLPRTYKQWNVYGIVTDSFIATSPCVMIETLEFLQGFLVRANEDTCLTSLLSSSVSASLF